MIIDFLETKTSKENLKIALDVLKEFKSNQSTEEWAWTWFSAWTKLEQLEEYLEHLVNEKPLKKDTLEYIEANKDIKTDVKKGD